MTRRRVAHGRRGVALLVALWLVVMLGTIGTGVAAAARSAGGVASNARARATSRYSAESGLAVAEAALARALAQLPDPARRANYLNHLSIALGTDSALALGDGRASVELLDLNARVDVNAATAEQLTRLFSFFAPPAQAEAAARAVRAWIERPSYSSGLEVPGPTSGVLISQPLRSLDELRRVPGFPVALAEAARPFLTVDGDGVINRVTASDTVRAAAAGDLRDEPSRILVVSRGWRAGHAAVHEIEAVYAISGNMLALVRRRERAP